MASASDTQITHTQRLWLYIVSAVVIVFLIAPTLIVVPMSFSGGQYLEFPPDEWSTEWYEHFFSSVEWREASIVSLRAAALTVLVATPLGTMAAYGLHTMKLRFTPILHAMLVMPMIVPLILIGIGALFLYARLGIVNTTFGLVLAHSMLALPFVLVTVSSGLATFDINQELAARSLGASRFRAFLMVTLPQIKLSVLAGALLAFITSLDEVIVALFITGGPNSTLTRRMFTSLRDELDPTIAAVSSLLIVISVCLALVYQHVSRSKDKSIP